jgi:hypothetical protein
MTAIPAALRQRAREEVQRRRQQQAARTLAPADATPPSAPRAATHRTTTINPEELYPMAVDAKLEITLKFSTLPNAQPAGQGKRVFALKTPDGQFVTAEVNSKVWNKLVKAAEDWPAWTAALSGTMGERTEKGFTLVNLGLQVFEHKLKVPAAAAPVRVETASAPAVTDPSETAPVPPAAESANPNPISRKPVLSLKNHKTTS